MHHAKAYLCGFTALCALVTSPLITCAQLPDLPSVIQPPGNPGVPAGAQTFNPPVAGITPPSNAPAIATYTKFANPNETIALTGVSLSSGTGSLFGDDVSFITYGQTSGINGTTADAQIDRLDGLLGAITLDSSLPQDSMFFVWSQDNNGTSYPVAVNRTDAWWIGPDTVTNSGSDIISVFGRNLTSGTSGTTSYVYINAVGATSGTFVTPVAANPYKVDFQVPLTLSSGTYQIWVHNGRGGSYGWSTPSNPDGTPKSFTVSAPLTSGTTITLTSGTSIVITGTTYNVYGDGVHDDTPVIQAAINAATTYSGSHAGTRSTVILSSTTPVTYLLYGAITPYPYVALVGSGTTTISGSTAWLTTLRRASGPLAFLPFDHNANDISGNGFNGTATGSAVIGGSGGTKGTGTLVLDGTTGYVSVSGTGLLNLSGAMSIGARIMISATTSGVHTIVTHGTTGGGTPAVFLRLNGANIELGYNLGAGGGDVVAASAAYGSGNLNKWITLVGTYDNGAWSLYRGTSSTPISSATSAQGAPAVTGNWSIGADPGGSGNFLAGNIDAVRIYNRALSPLELTDFGFGWNEAPTLAEPEVITINATNGVTLVSATSSAISGIQMLTDVKPFVGDNAGDTSQYNGGGSNWMGGTSVVVPNGAFIQYNNLYINAGPWRGITAASQFSMTNSTVIGNSNNIGYARMVFFDHDNFYGDYDSAFALNNDSNRNICITNCTAADYNYILPSELILSDTNVTKYFPGGHVGNTLGRLYWGDTPTTSLRFVYIANNTTINYAPSPTAPSNDGEQICWDQNGGNLIPYPLLSVSGTSVTLQTGTIAGINSDYDVIVAGGPGIGQRRSIISSVTGGGSTVINLDQPWGAKPDTTSTILVGKVVADVAIYNNTLNGKSDFATRYASTSSTGIKVFNTGYDIIGDSNDISDVIMGIDLNGIAQGSNTLPIFNTLWINNSVSSAIEGIVFQGGVSGSASQVTPAVLNAVFRHNTVNSLTSGTGIGFVPQAGILANAGNLNVVEDGTFSNLTFGVNMSSGAETSNLVLRNDSFICGTGTSLPNSIGFVTATNNSNGVGGVNQNPDLIGSSFSGFASASATTGTTSYGARFYGAATGNNGKLYLAMKTTLSGTNPQMTVEVFDPTVPINQPAAFTPLNAVLGGTNGNLLGTTDILFINSGTATYPGAANPKSCSMYLLNSGTGGVNGNGTLSKYTFDASGSMSSGTDVITSSAGIGVPVAMASDTNGYIYIASVVSGTLPHVWKWDGSTVSNFIDTPLFKAAGNNTTRNPAGIAIDSSGKFYIPYNSIAAMRRFVLSSGTGAFDQDITTSLTSANYGPVRLGTDNNIYFCSGPAIYQHNPASSGTAGTAVFANVSSMPAFSGQPTFVNVAFGPKCVTDPDPNDVSDIYVASSGAFFVGARGPGALISGTQINFRDNVYEVAELPIRYIALSGVAGSGNNDSFQFLNAGLVGLNYTLSSNQSWLNITSGTSGMLGAISGSNATFNINTTGLTSGTTYSADITFSYTNALGAEAGQFTLGVTFDLVNSGPSVSGVTCTSTGENLANLQATVNPQSLATNVYFQYGLTSGYGMVSGTTSLAASGSSSLVTTQLLPLLPHTTYHYNCVAINSSGTTSSGDGTFSTLSQTDMNKAGYADLITIDPVGRGTTILYQQAGTLTGSATGPSIPFTQTLAGTADINQDGNNDWVVLSNTNSAANTTQVWNMSGTTVLSTTNGPTIPSGYDVVAVKDTNNDGHPDLVLLNGTSSQVEVLKLNGVSVSGTVSYSGTIPAGFAVAGMDYMTPDGLQDLVVWSGSTGATKYIGLSSSNTLVSSSGPTIPAGLQLMGVDAYNGPNASEFLVYNPTSGSSQIWSVSGTTVTGSSSGPTVPAGVNLIGARSIQTGTTHYTVNTNAMATANNGRLYTVRNFALTSATAAIVSVFDPANHTTAPAAYIWAGTGTNSNLYLTKDILFTNTTYTGTDSTNPVSCNMYTLNSGTGTNGTLSKYTFDASGSMTYNGDVLTSGSNLGAVACMTQDGSGNIYIGSSGTNATVWKWDGTTLSTFLASGTLKFSSNNTVRNPGGLAFDNSGNLYVAYSSVGGIRCFNSSGIFVKDVTTVSNNLFIKNGPDGNMYFTSGTAVYRYVTSGTAAPTLYINGNSFPGIVGSSWPGLAFGFNIPNDLNSGVINDIYVGSSGGWFISAHGPGAVLTGSAAW